MLRFPRLTAPGWCTRAGLECKLRLAPPHGSNQCGIISTNKRIGRARPLSLLEPRQVAGGFAKHAAN